MSNDFRITLHFWVQSNTHVKWSDERSNVLSRMATFSQSVRPYGEASAVLDSVFASSRPTGLTQALVNRTFSGVAHDSLSEPSLTATT